MGETPDLFDPDDAPVRTSRPARRLHRALTPDAALSPLVVKLDRHLRAALDRVAIDRDAALPAPDGNGRVAVDPARPNVSACARSILAEWLARHGYLDREKAAGDAPEKADLVPKRAVRRRVWLDAALDEAIATEAAQAGLSVQRYLANLVEARGASTAQSFAREIETREQLARLLTESNYRLTVTARALRQLLGVLDAGMGGVLPDDLAQLRAALDTVGLHVGHASEALARLQKAKSNRN